MALAIPSGLIIQSTDPVDARFSVTNATARKALDVINVYEGLLVYEQDTNKLYKLTNATAPNLDASWVEIPDNLTLSLSQTIVGISASLANTPSLEASSSGDVTASLADGLVWIVAGEARTQFTSSNGETWIWSTPNKQWYFIPKLDQTAGDARYLVKATGGTVSGSITISDGNYLYGTSSWAQSASFATTALGVAGGTQGYIPVFGTGTSLADSVIYQLIGDTKIGIGTTNPVNTLQIAGNVSASSYTGSLFGTSSWAESSSIALTASYVPASSVAGLSLNQIVTGSVTASVDIGNTSFQINSGSNTLATLSNAGKFAVTSGSGSGYKSITLDPSGSRINYFLEGSYNTYINFSNGDFTYINNSGNKSFIAGTNNITADVLSSGLNSAYAALTLKSTLYGVSTTTPAINFTVYKTDGGNNNLSKLQIYNGDNGNVILLPHLPVSGGRVGIGTTTPTGSLHVSGTVYFSDLTDSSTANKVLLISSSGQIFTTASSAIGGGGSGPSTTKAGSASIASFGTSPLTSSVTFGSAFANNNYAVTVTGEDARAWTIQSKTSAGFQINSNSDTTLTGPVYWIATPFNNS